MKFCFFGRGYSGALKALKVIRPVEDIYESVKL